jgi:hypothetical protein
MPYKNKVFEKEHRKIRYQEHKEEVNLSNKKWKEKHKERHKELQKNWYLKHKEKILEKNKKRYEKNKKEILKKQREYSLRPEVKQHQKEYNKEYWSKEENKKRDREYRTFRYYNDVTYKLKTLLRRRICKMVKRGQKAGSAVRDLGCSVPELKEHLEKQFKPGMYWNNWSHNGWHVDHIKPLSSFDLTNRNDFLKATHYTNLQPLWAEENLLKADKFKEQ